MVNINNQKKARKTSTPIKKVNINNQKKARKQSLHNIT